MTDRLRFGGDVHELKLGASFTNNKTSSFHTLKCDFKPASVDASKMATVDVGNNNQVTVTVPHLDGAGVPQTVFKGNQRPYQKECVLIFDKNTGTITLEKLSSNIQVKKTRQEPAHKPAPISSSAPRPHTPIQLDTVGNCTQRSTSRTRVTSGARKGTSNAPSSLRASPPRHRTSPPQVAPWSANSGQSTLASLPMIGLEDMSAPIENQSQIAANTVHPMNGHGMEDRNMLKTQEPEAKLSSSSDSSSSDTDSDHSDSDGSDSEADNNPSNSTKSFKKNGIPENEVNGKTVTNLLPSILSTDLCLSESGSEDDF